MNELTYTRCGDYYIPDLKLIEAFPYLFIIVVLVIIQSIRKMVARRKEKLASLEQLHSQQAA